MDDILNTGRTFSQASKIVQEGGATEIYAVASHGLFAGTAAQLLDEAPIKEILVTDSVASKEQHPKNIAFLTASDLIADAIHRIQEHQPLSPLFKFTSPEKKTRSNSLIYLDNAATTALSPTALQRMMEVAQENYGNPSSIHQSGRKANQCLRQSRQEIAQILSASPEQIIFTSGGSEADTLAIQGYALAHQSKGKHLITTAIEHHAVLHTMQYLEDRFGFEVTYIQPVNQVITAQQILDALRPDTILVSVMFANNETGQLLPIKEIESS